MVGQGLMLLVEEPVLCADDGGRQASRVAAVRVVSHSPVSPMWHHGLRLIIPAVGGRCPPLRA